MHDEIREDEVEEEVAPGEEEIDDPVEMGVEPDSDF